MQCFTNQNVDFRIKAAPDNSKTNAHTISFDGHTRLFPNSVSLEGSNGGIKESHSKVPTGTPGGCAPGCRPGARPAVFSDSYRDRDIGTIQGAII